MPEPLFPFGSHYRLALQAPYGTTFVQQMSGTELQFARSDCQLVIDFFQEQLEILQATQKQEVKTAVEAMVLKDNQHDVELQSPGKPMEVGAGVQWMINHPNQNLLDSAGSWWFYDAESKLFFTSSTGSDFEIEPITSAIEKSLSFTISAKKTNDIIDKEEPIPDTLKPLYQSIPQLPDFPTTGEINKHNPYENHILGNHQDNLKNNLNTTANHEMLKQMEEQSVQLVHVVKETE